MAAVLRQRGIEHERNHVDGLRDQGLAVVDISGYFGDEAVGRTLEAMRVGVPAILQGALRQGPFYGRPDVLRRVETASAFGAWSYEVEDTKLTTETRGGTILQLVLYSELLSSAQGTVPESFHVITPDVLDPVQTYRVLDFDAYFRLVRDRLKLTTASDPGEIIAATYPEPVEHCDVCPWWSVCDQRRRADDHLSLVAGLSRLQSREFQVAGVSTLAQLGAMPVPLPFTPRRGAPETYVRVREQARVQLEARVTGGRVYELLPVELDRGLCRLPPPSIGDVFLDLEGDPFAGEGGCEYCFGVVTVGPGGAETSRAYWAWSPAQERTAFEAVVDLILESWATNPEMHVYHYAPYEPAAFKRLMGRYGSREAEVDRMLRAGLFVDLYAVVRHALRASVERYSIKDLEPFYEFARTIPLPDARAGLRAIERALELGARDAVTPEALAVVEAYNRDDCLSARRLRDWLEELRRSIEATEGPLARPSPQAGDHSERVDERSARVVRLMEALTAGVPAEPSERTADHEATWLLAHLLDWHRREDKAPWWEFFRLRDLPEEDLFHERAALAGLQYVEHVGGTKRSQVHRYAFPPQDTEVRKGDQLHLPDGTDFGHVAAIDRIQRTVDVKKRVAQADAHPSAVFAHSVVPSGVLAEALLRIGEDVAQRGLEGTRYRAAAELLLGRAPRPRLGELARRPGELVLDHAVRVGLELDQTVLAVQGPPGAGKTFTGARMICELVRQGRRVGVTAVSHKVIRNLLNAVALAARERGIQVPCLQKMKEAGTPSAGVEETTDNRDALERLADGRARVLGATPWVWARPEAEEAVDVLFVDEAGQMSLANVLATSPAARSIVLLGDPQQLEQPQQGTHPEGADRSALEHILQGHKTIPDDRGIFLPETWRLAPSLCRFTSEVFYEGRLRSVGGLERQALVGTTPFEGTGLWVVSVEHEGNQNSSLEEVAVVDRILGILLSPGAHWIDKDGSSHRMTGGDVLVVAPYNSHVSLLGERLAPRGVPVGTVDRFQGQEAPVVVYAMATSAPEDAPRGMEFLYSLNRLNVATSRARCACILVASPRLFQPDCKSPRQMQLANALCRYLELARSVTTGPE